MDTGKKAMERAAINAANGERTVYTLPDGRAAIAFAQACRVARARDARQMRKLFTPQEVGSEWGKSQWDRLKITVRGCEVEIAQVADQLPPMRTEKEDDGSSV